MDRDAKRLAFGAGMVALGLGQAGWGAFSGDPVFAVLGVVYALCGVGFLRVSGVIG